MKTFTELLENINSVLNEKASHSEIRRLDADASSFEVCLDVSFNNYLQAETAIKSLQKLGYTVMYIANGSD